MSPPRRWASDFSPDQAPLVFAWRWLAGVAGGFYAHQALFIDANQFDFSRSALTFLYVVLGGAANPLGPLVGAAMVTLLPELLRFVQIGA